MSIIEAVKAESRPSGIPIVADPRKSHSAVRACWEDPCKDGASRPGVQPVARAGPRGPRATIAQLTIPT